MPDAVLRADGVSRFFGGITAVSDVSIDLRPSEIHAVIGPNGAGKSTLLNLLAGDLRPMGGRIVLDGRDVTGADVIARSRLGLARSYQRSAIIPGLPARDMVRLAALRKEPSWWRMLRPFSALPDVVARADRTLAQAGLAARGDVLADTLTHGEKRRLELAAVLALEPSILLLDEPLAGLGPAESREVVSLIAALRERHAVMVVEHDVEAVFAIADRVSVLVNGRLTASGSPAAVRADPLVRRAYLGDGEI